MLDKREWVYTQAPAIYDIASCKCGNEVTQWSEYKDHLWCSKCKIDFIPEHWGIFDGAIMLELCSKLGIHFDRFYIKEEKIVPFDIHLSTYPSLN